MTYGNSGFKPQRWIAFAFTTIALALILRELTLQPRSAVLWTLTVSVAVLWAAAGWPLVGWISSRVRAYLRARKATKFDSLTPEQKKAWGHSAIHVYKGKPPGPGEPTGEPIASFPLKLGDQIPAVHDYDGFMQQRRGDVADSLAKTDALIERSKSLLEGIQLGATRPGETFSDRNIAGMTVPELVAYVATAANTWGRAKAIHELRCRGYESDGTAIIGKEFGRSIPTEPDCLYVATVDANPGDGQLHRSYQASVRIVPPLTVHEGQAIHVMGSKVYVNGVEQEGHVVTHVQHGAVRLGSVGQTAGELAASAMAAVNFNTVGKYAQPMPFTLPEHGQEQPAPRVGEPLMEGSADPIDLPEDWRGPESSGDVLVTSVDMGDPVYDSAEEGLPTQAEALNDQLGDVFDSLPPNARDYTAWQQASFIMHDVLTGLELQPATIFHRDVVDVYAEPNATAWGVRPKCKRGGEEEIPRVGAGEQLTYYACPKEWTSPQVDMPNWVLQSDLDRNVEDHRWPVRVINPKNLEIVSVITIPEEFRAVPKAGAALDKPAT